MVIVERIHAMKQFCFNDNFKQIICSYSSIQKQTLAFASLAASASAAIALCICTGSLTSLLQVSAASATITI